MLTDFPTRVVEVPLGERAQDRLELGRTVFDVGAGVGRQASVLRGRSSQ